MNGEKTLSIALVGVLGVVLLCSEAWAWKADINGTAGFDDMANAVTVDAAGDVVAAGFTFNTGTFTDFTVIKFSGADGTELWRKVINGTSNLPDVAEAVTVDAVGDVVAAGWTQNTGTGIGFTVVKFSGTDGAELWRKVIDGQARAVAVDTVGDVVAAGAGPGFFVVKFSGTNGTELWRGAIVGATVSANAVTVDAAGDVVAAGNTTATGPDFTVVKFSGVDGTELWRQFISGSAFNSFDVAFAVTADTVGDVVAAGVTENAGTGRDFTVAKFDRTSGTVLWRRDIIGTANGNDEARAVALDGAGDVVAAGFTFNIGTAADFTVVKLRGADGIDF